MFTSDDVAKMQDEDRKRCSEMHSLGGKARVGVGNEEAYFAEITDVDEFELDEKGIVRPFSAHSAEHREELSDDAVTELCAWIEHGTPFSTTKLFSFWNRSDSLHGSCDCDWDWVRRVSYEWDVYSSTVTIKFESADTALVQDSVDFVVEDHRTKTFRATRNAVRQLLRWFLPRNRCISEIGLVEKQMQKMAEKIAKLHALHIVENRVLYDADTQWHLILDLAILQPIANRSRMQKLNLGTILVHCNPVRWALQRFLGPREFTALACASTKLQMVVREHISADAAAESQAQFVNAKTDH